MMKKKMIAIWGICAMVCGLFTGCGSETLTVEQEETQTIGIEIEGEAKKPQNNKSENGKAEDMKSEDSKSEEQKTKMDLSGQGNLQEFSKALLSASLDESNPMLSPVSAYLALSLTGAGANGDTKAEFEQVMGADHQTVSGELLSVLPAEQEGMQVVLADSVWMDERLVPVTEWRKTAEERYQAQVYQTKLSTQETMGSINTWIDDQTRGLIQNFLTQPLEEETRLALFNTIYFKGDWENPFSGDNTHDMPFTLENGEEIQTPMMRKYNQSLAYVKSDLGDGIVLPYKNSDLVFVALKPAAGMTVREMYKALDMEQVQTLVEQAEDQMVDLLLPKFEVSFDRVLNQDLQNMGLVSAFDAGRADFSGMGTDQSGEPLYIGLVRQKAIFILDEEGTEAAAVTSVMMRTNGALRVEEPLLVHFDEPFLYMVYDSERNVPLFMGIMDDPS